MGSFFSDHLSVASAVHGKISFDGSETHGTSAEDISQYGDAEPENPPPVLLKVIPLIPPTDEQLLKERLSIFQALEELEKQCHQIRQQGEKSQALIQTHKELLKAHYDHFCVYQRLLACQVVKEDALDQMPVRIWLYAIHPLLELLRTKSPDSQEDLIHHLLFSYSMMTQLLELAPRLEDIWMECLGDLARYFMAKIELDSIDRNNWKEVARSWYSRIAARDPDNGRIQDHLGDLEFPNGLQQFFYFSKALVSGKPFPAARESMKKDLFATDRYQPTPWLTLTGLFIAAHRALFNETPAEFTSSANKFLSELPLRIDQLSLQGERGEQEQLGLQMTCCNIAVMSQYLNQAGIETTHVDASSFAFDTLDIMLSGVKNSDMYPSLHVALAFVYCLTFNSVAMQQLESRIPWTKLTDYLNHLLRPEISAAKIESPSFPHFQDGNAQRLPEDFSMSGLGWTKPYYPEGFFQGAPSEEERPSVEKPEVAIHRSIRCLWLGVRIASTSRFIQYDQREGFVPLGSVST